MSNRFNQSKRPQNPNIAPFARKRHAIITVVVDAQNWFAMVVLKCCVFVQHVILLDLCYSFEINQYLYTCLYSSCSAESRLSNEYNITIFGQKHSEKSAKLWVNSTKWVRTKIYLVDNVKERNFQFFCVYRVLLEAAHRINPISRLIVRVLITILNLSNLLDLFQKPLNINRFQSAQILVLLKITTALQTPYLKHLATKFTVLQFKFRPKSI